MPIAVIVDWYGPFKSLKRFKKEATSGWLPDKVLYFGASYRDEKSNDAVIEYVGLSTRPRNRFANHPKLQEPGIDEFYLGEITTKGLPGRRTGKFPDDLRAAEKALIAELQPVRNSQDKISPPEDCIVVFSRFFGKNKTEKPKPTPCWFKPVIAYNSWSEEWIT